MLQLTPTQRDIFLEGKLFGGAVNNIGGYQRYFCALDVQRFMRARELMLQGNDAYSLRFSECAGGCLPLTSGQVPVLPIHDYSAHSDPHSAALEYIRHEFETPFADLAEKVFQDALLKISAHEFWYFAKAHHLIMDGWGFALQMQRCLQAYAQIGSGEAADAAGPSFAAYMREHARGADSDAYAQSRDHWLAQFDAMPKQFLAPRSPPAQRTTSARVSAAIDARLFAALNELAKAAGANIVAVFYAALYVYFSRAYGCDDLVIASPVHNRRSAVEKNIIGSLVNVNAHRLVADPEIRFAELVRRVAQLQKKNYRHSSFPMGDLVRALSEKFPGSGRSLNQVSFNYQKLDFQLTVDGHAVETHYLSHHRERVPLTFVVCEYGPKQDVAFHLDYRTDYFDAGEAAAMLERLHGLLVQATQAPDQAIHRYRLPTPLEWHKLLVEWNDTAVPLRHADWCLHEFFERQVQRTPDAIAVVGGGETLSYRELNERADRIAHRLAELGAGPDRFIGVCHARTPNLVAAIFGILKAGAAYVPIDPSYPTARIQYILDDAQVRVVLADAQGAQVLHAGKCAVVDVETALVDAASVRSSPTARIQYILDDAQVRVVLADAQGAQVLHAGKCAVVDVETALVDAASVRSSARAPGLTPSHLAYVIYTSGSTGHPKGVLIEHRNATAFVEWALAAFSADDLAVVLAATSICFDLSVFEMFVPLAMGGRIVLADNVLALRNHASERISLINTVPSAIKSLLEAAAIPRSVRCINLAGELLRQDLVDALYALPGVRVHDLYGPSEDTTYSTWCLRRPHGVETIGRPIANTRVYVCDEHGELLPPGLVGELCIGGAGLARGYLNQPALTDSKFVHNRHANSRVYRTGDLVRFGADGALHYIGRKDSQVKVRGYRIELGEIEACALRHPAVKECVVVAHEDVAGEANRVLVAYLVPKTNVDGAAAERQLIDAVIGFLSASLPAYMVPSLSICLPALPLTANGKVDRRALPVPGQRGASLDGPAPPHNPLEQALSALWCAILKTTAIGVRDDFFARGGDSLLLMRLATAIEAEFGVTLDLSVLFAHPTIEAQAKQIERASRLERLLDAVGAAADEPCVSHITL